MPRNFNGSSDFITVALGNLSGINSGTFAAVVKVNTAQYGQLIGLSDSSSLSVMAFEVTPSGDYSFNVDSGSSYTDTAGGPTVADDWCVVVATKTNASSSPLFWKYVFSTGVVTTATGSTVNATGRTADHVELGRWDGSTDYLAGDLAAGAIWKTVLTDEEVRNLFGSFQEWYTADWFTILDQASTSVGLRDLINGALETSISGTSVGTSSAPMGYGADVMVSTAIDAGGSSPVDVTLTKENFVVTHRAPQVQIAASVNLTKLNFSVTHRAPEVQVGASPTLTKQNFSVTHRAPEIQVGAAVNLIKQNFSVTHRQPSIPTPADLKVFTVTHRAINLSIGAQVNLTKQDMTVTNRFASVFIPGTGVPSSTSKPRKRRRQ